MGIKDWDQKQLIQWVNGLNYDKDKKDAIIKGVTDYGATGDDVWDADKDDLAEALNIDGLLAKKFAKSIAQQRQNQLPSNVSEGNNNNINTETPFTLNIGGSTPTTLKNIKSSMSIGEIKKRYLEEHGHQITSAKMKGVNIKFLGQPLNDEARTLKSYGILNGDGISPFVTYSLNGGMLSNDNETKVNDDTAMIPDEHLFQIGQEVKCIDKNWPTKGYFDATVIAVERDSIEIRWGGNYTHLTQKISESEWEGRIEGFTKDTKSNSNCHQTADSNLTTKPDNNKETCIDGSDYDTIPMTKWKGIHTKYWVHSLAHPFPKYADKFEKINGKQLMDTTSDDLTVIISSKMIRKKLIKHLNAAKLKYVQKANSENENGNMNNENMRNGSTNNYTNRNACVIGLHNLGNTCFLNTCIQLLSHTPKLAKYFAKRAQFAQITDNDIGIDDNAESNGFTLNPFKWSWGNGGNRNINISMLNAWIHLCDKMYNHQSKKSYSPTAIISALNQIDSHFGSGAQDDSARALRYILQKLDEEIENEILSKKNKGKTQKDMNINISEMNRYVISHSNQLNEKEETMVIQELLRRHNPNDSIIRKLFDGIQRECIECVHCHGKFQQYVIFRDLDIPVINNHVTFKNVNIVYNKKHRSLKQCKVLSHCTIDVLKYKVIESLNAKNVGFNDIQIATIPNDDISNMKILNSNTNISELCSFSGGSIFAFISGDDRKENMEASNTSKLMQFVLFIDKNGKISKFDTQLVNCNVYNFINDELKQYKLIDDDQYEYQLLFNGTNINISKLKQYSFKTLSNSDCNSLFLLCIDKRCNDFPLYEFDKTDIRAVRQAMAKYPNTSPLNALRTYKSDLSQGNDSIFFQLLGFLCSEVENDSKLQLNNVQQTILQFENKQKLINCIATWLKQFNSTSSTTKKLDNLEDCVSTYQQKHILDRESYEHTCPYCKVQCKLINMERTIVYTPPILIFHLDRFNNKNNAVQSKHVNTYKSATRFKRNDKVQVFDESLQKWYNAKIIQTKTNKVKVSYDNISNNFDEWINKNAYSTRIGRRSNSSHSYSTYSNKFRHCIDYKMKICLGKTEHELFGVANHSGSTSEYGHYTATVKSSMNGCWYNISDSSINEFGVNALGNTETATIIMYSNIQ